MVVDFHKNAMILGYWTAIMWYTYSIRVEHFNKLASRSLRDIRPQGGGRVEGATIIVFQNIGPLLHPGARNRNSHRMSNNHKIDNLTTFFFGVVPILSCFFFSTHVLL